MVLDFIKVFILISFHILEYMHDGYFEGFFLKYFYYIEFLKLTLIGLKGFGEDILSWLLMFVCLC